MNISTTRKYFMIYNLSPHHSSMRCVLWLIITLDGEDVIDCKSIELFGQKDGKNSGKLNNYTIFVLYFTMRLFS